MLDDQGPTTADMTQSVTKIDRAIKERRNTDRLLVNFWLYFFLLSWATIGIYGIVLFFQRINRIDGFSARKQRYYDALLTWTERYAEREHRQDEVHNAVTDMRAEISAAYRDDMRPIGAGVSFLLTIVTIGIYGFYVLYRINRYWWDAQILEQEFDDQLSQTWLNLGLARYPTTFTLDQRKQRSYALYLILSFITFGVWAVYWDYQLQIDPDNLYGEFHTNEDTVLQTVRAH